jgi:hypothetical protein
MNAPFPPLPEGWNVSSVAPDYFRIDDRQQGKLFEGSQDQCAQYITQGARLQQLEAFAQRVYDTHGLLHDGTLYEEAKRLVKPAAQAQRAPELDEPERYKQQLRERAAAKYPNASPEQTAKLEKEIQRRVEVVRSYEQHLLKVAAESFPRATAEERQALLSNIKQEVVAYRDSMEKHLRQQQQRSQEQHAPPSVVRQQQRGMGGYER